LNGAALCGSCRINKTLTKHSQFDDLAVFSYVGPLILRGCVRRVDTFGQDRQTKVLIPSGPNLYCKNFTNNFDIFSNLPLEPPRGSS